MEKIELSLLSQKQVFEDFNGEVLDVFKRYSPRASATDLAKLMGTPTHEQCTFSYDDRSLEYINHWLDTSVLTVIDDRSPTTGNTTAYWLKDLFKSPYEGSSYYVDRIGEYKPALKFARVLGVRPILSSLAIPDFDQYPQKEGFVGVKEVCFGEYPQNIVPKESDFFLDLERAYTYGDLLKTGKTYTLPIRQKGFPLNFQLETFLEYVYKGDTYIRFISNNQEIGILSDNSRSLSGTFFIKVSPVVWFYDEKTNSLISKKCLLASGLHWSSSMFDFDERPTSFKDTDLKQYMDTYLYRDLIPFFYQEEKSDVLTLPKRFTLLKEHFNLFRLSHPELGLEINFFQDQLNAIQSEMEDRGYMKVK